MKKCGQIIREALLQKFNEDNFHDNTKQEKSRYTSIYEVYESIGKDFTIQEASSVINNLKICDPSVGTGDLLISALREIIVLKNELKLLLDLSGKLLENIDIKVVNGKLIITNEEGQLFDYNSQVPESQRIQEALFYEKKRIIENCLFGADINHGLVDICCLRLRMELFKNRYSKEADLPEFSSPVCYANSPEIREDFKEEPKYESPPNLIFNIKKGNFDERVMEEGCVFIRNNEEL